jgi:hypothetical protein
MLEIRFPEPTPSKHFRRLGAEPVTSIWMVFGRLRREGSFAGSSSFAHRIRRQSQLSFVALGARFRSSTSGPIRTIVLTLVSRLST